MTDLRKAAEMALEALEEQWEEHEAIDALRQALAQTEKPPVKSYCGGKPNYCTPEVTTEGPLYTAPPKREWVGLTEDEVWELVDQSLSKKWGFLDEQAFAKTIEAKLKEKNSGAS